MRGVMWSFWRTELDRRVGRGLCEQSRLCGCGKSGDWRWVEWCFVECAFVVMMEEEEWGERGL